MLDFEAEFAGERHRFAVPLTAIARIESERAAPLGAIMRRVSDLYVTDIAAVLQAGLEGGGTPLAEARQTINAGIPGNIEEAAEIASRVLAFAVAGTEPDWESAPGAAREGLLDIKAIWRAGGSAGLDPAKLGEMTLAQIQAHFEGIIDANTPPEKRKQRPSADERAAIKDALTNG